MSLLGGVTVVLLAAALFGRGCATWHVIFLIEIVYGFDLRCELEQLLIRGALQEFLSAELDFIVITSFARFGTTALTHDTYVRVTS